MQWRDDEGRSGPSQWRSSAPREGAMMSGSLIVRKPEQGCLSPKKGNGCGSSDDLASFWRASVPGGGQMV
jgi:hypothetical protein